VDAVLVEVLTAGTPPAVIAHDDIKLPRAQAAIRLYASIASYPQDLKAGISVWA
jgi:hypothetical protein